MKREDLHEIVSRLEAILKPIIERAAQEEARIVAHSLVMTELRRELYSALREFVRDSIEVTAKVKVKDV